MSRGRYTTRRFRSCDDAMMEPIILPNLEVDERQPEFTGLLDQYGDPLFRMPETIGFHHPDEIE